MSWDVGADQRKDIKGMQIVCIGLETQRDGLSYIWDIIEQHEDDVELTGQGYELLEVIKVSNLTKVEVAVITNLIKPPLQTVSGIDYWYDIQSQEWYQILIQPKYELSIRGFTQQDIITLRDELMPLEAKTVVIGKIVYNITLYPENKMIVMPSNGG